MAEEPVKPVISVRKSGVLVVTKTNRNCLQLSKYVAIPATDENNSVVHIACGPEHTAIVMQNGYVYTFGNNLYNALGLKNTLLRTSEPTLVPTLSFCHIVQVACGNSYTLFVSREGTVFVCGDSSSGQLGTGSVKCVSVPAPLPIIPPIKKVSVGSEHTVALSCTGDVWVTGSNRDRQLGLAKRKHIFTTKFIRVADVEGPFIDVSCGLDHTALLAESGSIYMAGSNTEGQLGFGQSVVVDGFKHLALPSPTTSVACGFRHTVAVAMDGTILAWGRNTHGQLGTKDYKSRCLPTNMVGLENYNISKVYAGGNFTALISNEGNVLFRGSNGYDPEEDPLLGHFTVERKSPSLVVKQVAFSTGSTMLLIESKQTDELSKVTTLEESILRLLECPVCYEYMCAPIHMCRNGHSFCNSCRLKIPDCSLCHELFAHSRNYSLESISKEILLLCPNCTERVHVRFVQAHGDVCLGRKYDCPLQDTCVWTGRPETMLYHCICLHPLQTHIDTPCCVIQSSLNLVNTDVLAVNNELFTLHRLYNTTSKSFQAVARYIGDPKNVSNYKIEIKFIVGDGDLSVAFRALMCPDTEPIERMFQSPPHCVTVKGERLDTFTEDDTLKLLVTVLLSGQNDQPIVSPTGQWPL